MSDRSTIEEALQAYAAGEFLIVLDDEDRENEGDLIIAADAVDPSKMAFMIRHTSGVICAAMPGERADELDLPLMVEANTAATRTPFTVTVDYRHGTSTGISAADRVATVRALHDPTTRPNDLARPGHIFPLRASPGGVLKRFGHTEAAVDLGVLTGRSQVGVLSEVVNDDGTMARMDDLVPFAERHGIHLITIADLIDYRRRTEKLVERYASAKIPTRHGVLDAIAYRSSLDGVDHAAFVLGDVAGADDVLVRVHSECLTGDLFGSLRCDCGSQIEAALQLIGDAGSGVIVYLRGHEGRGIGLAHKLRAYELQEQGHDTVDANTVQGLPVDARDYGIGAQILTDLGITTMRLMTNNPAKYVGLQGFGLEITERVPLDTPPNPENLAYLRAKRDRLGHLLAAIDTEGAS